MVVVAVRFRIEVSILKGGLAGARRSVEDPPG